MTQSKKIGKNDVFHVAKLANIPLNDKQADELTDQVGVTVTYVSQLQSLQTEGVIETSQVTGLENIYRDDEVDTARTFSQEEALKNAKRTHNGFFIVDAIFEG